MTTAVYSFRFATAQTDQALVTVGAAQYIHVKGVAISVPAGQNAQIKLGSAQIATTEGSLSLLFDTKGPNGDDLTVTSSGAVSVTVLYQTGTRV